MTFVCILYNVYILSYILVYIYLNIYTHTNIYITASQHIIPVAAHQKNYILIDYATSLNKITKYNLFNVPLHIYSHTHTHINCRLIYIIYYILLYIYACTRAHPHFLFMKFILTLASTQKNK